MVNWNELECLYALETYRLLELNKKNGNPQTKTSIIENQLVKMNNHSGRNRTYKALEFKLQNVSAIDPRDDYHHQ
jgi:hypothetical protein